MVEALSRRVEEVLGAGLEVNEVVTFHFVFYIIVGCLDQLILASSLPSIIKLMLTKSTPGCNTLRRALFGTSFKFPKHKELFTEDYYDESKDSKSPYESEFPGGPDSEDFNAPSHRATQTGILSNYKK